MVVSFRNLEPKLALKKLKLYALLNSNRINAFNYFWQAGTSRPIPSFCISFMLGFNSPVYQSFQLANFSMCITTSTYMSLNSPRCFVFICIFVYVILAQPAELPCGSSVCKSDSYKADSRVPPETANFL